MTSPATLVCHKVCVGAVPQCQRSVACCHGLGGPRAPLAVCSTSLEHSGALTADLPGRLHMIYHHWCCGVLGVGPEPYVLLCCLVFLGSRSHASLYHVVGVLVV